MSAFRPAAFGLIFAVALAASLGASASAQDTGGRRDQESACTQLGSLALPQAKITSAESFGAGKFKLEPSGAPAGASAISNLPAFCRVRVTAAPSSDSEINIEVWLPERDWNGKLEAVGNGGWAGAISYSALAMALVDGYAAVSTDTGHTGANGTFAVGHPEKLVDFAYRSTHEMTTKAKAIVNTFYGAQPKYTYWNGCSTGGRQGLLSAVRYPSDFDGMVIGDPITPRAVHDAWELSIALSLIRNPAGILPESKLELLHHAVIEACDAKDGVKDGVLAQPENCHFDPKKLACNGADKPDCLTADQIKTVELVHSPFRAKGKDIYPGLPYGTELGWADRLNPPADGKIPGPAQSLIWQGFGPEWDWKRFDLDTDLPVLERLDALQSVTTYNLSSFTSHGGKVLMYSGWGSPIDSGFAAIDLFKKISGSTPRGDSSMRLFLVPAMGHCTGGEGATDKFNAVSSLAHWVETGAAPKQITAAATVASFARSGQQISRTRPLCAYPQVAHYKGAGDTEDAANFECKAP